ncbi:MAG TPA: folate-binding protein YgfZ [Polyangiaceae bacterium]|nr:folate-binding protein YgfZ [Polyangiaceae bacterium]
MTSAWAARSEALWVEAPQLGTLAIAGADRRSWLNGLCTADVAKLGPETASYGLILVKIGRIVTDVFIVDAKDRILLGVPRDRVALVREHFEKYIIMEDVTHDDASAEFAWAHGHGPLAESLAVELAAKHAGFGGAVDLTGLGGAVVVVPTASAEALWADLGAREGVVLGSEADWDALRVHRTFPRFGVDFGEKNYPQEAALEKIAVSFNKGCYLGQEVVCRLEMRGHVIKKIAPVRLAEGALPSVGAEVLSADGKPVGAVSSAASDPAGPLALAMLRVDFTEPGTKVFVGGREATVLAGR